MVSFAPDDAAEPLTVVTGDDLGFVKRGFNYRWVDDEVDICWTLHFLHTAEVCTRLCRNHCLRQRALCPAYGLLLVGSKL